MAKTLINNIKLGIFVLAGLLFLVLLLYMIGKNRNLFGDTYILKARFDNIQGLVTGNNVRYAGIQSGTVKEINILSDTSIEVVMVMDKDMLPIIHKNAVASIGTEGLVGNKVINILPAHQPGPLAVEGDMLVTKRSVNTDEMLETLSNTNKDIAVITAEIKTTIKRINNSQALWNLLNDQSIPKQLRLSVANIQAATGKAGRMVDDLQSIVSDIKNGKGSAGAILRDSSIALNLNDAILKIKSAGEQADSLMDEIHTTVAGLQNDINNGNGTVHALFKDSAIVHKLNTSLDNIQKGTDGFNQNMEALKHNFLFRGYFRKLEKQKQKEKK